MDILNYLGFMAFIFCLVFVFAIDHFKKRISELTFAVGHLLEEVEKLKNKKIN